MGIDGVALAELVAMVGQGDLSASAAKEVLAGMIEGEGSAREVAEGRDLLQMSDRGALDEIVASVLAGNADAVDRYRAGEEKVIGFLVGAVMRASGGKADPQLAGRLLRERLEA